MTTIPVITDAQHTATDSTTSIEDIALDWLYAKDVENAAKNAEKIRKAAGTLLARLLGAGGTVTCNKGGFRTYVLTVSARKGRVSADRAIDALVEAGKVSREDADAALEASRGEGTDVIGLKPIKS